MLDRNKIELKENDKVKVFDSKNNVILICIYVNNMLFDESETKFDFKNAWLADPIQIEKI